MLKDALYGGINAAVVTAMNADLSIDLDRMAAHCRWLLANGCNGLAVLGTTGEANSLGISERIEVLEGLVARGIPAAKMLPGTGTTAITDTVLLTRKAAELGCRGALLLPPFYYKNPSDDGLLAYFNEVIQRVGGDIKLYLYNFPQQSAIPFSVDFIGRLLRANPGKVKGIKDSSGNYENSLAYVEAFARDGFEVYAGDDALLKPLLEKGSAGCITAASNVNCALGAEVYANWNNAKGAAAQDGPVGDPQGGDLGAADPGTEDPGGAQYRRCALAEHPPAAPEADRGTGGRAVHHLRRQRHHTGEGGLSSRMAGRHPALVFALSETLGNAAASAALPTTRRIRSCHTCFQPLEPPWPWPAVTNSLECVPTRVCSAVSAGRVTTCTPSRWRKSPVAC